MFGVTGGYHRYFSHRTYRTSRWFQFCLAWLAQTSLQAGAPGAAADHHKHSALDTKGPPSWREFGFWYSHVGWIPRPRPRITRTSRTSPVPRASLAEQVPPRPGRLARGGDVLHRRLARAHLGLLRLDDAPLARHLRDQLARSLVGPPPLRHVGRQQEQPRARAFITMGEGWHNNHHYYQRSVRQGFFWWEVDMTLHPPRDAGGRSRLGPPAAAAEGARWQARGGRPSAVRAVTVAGAGHGRADRGSCCRVSATSALHANAIAFIAP